MSFLGFHLTKEDIERFERLCKKLHQKEQSNLGSEITDVWIDDPFNIERKWVSKLRALDHPNKKHRPKQQMPYWAVNWRKK